MKPLVTWRTTGWWDPQSSFVDARHRRRSDGSGVRSGNVRGSGPLAQLVAHLHDAQGVTGSSPVRPTRKVQFRGYNAGDWVSR